MTMMRWSVRVACVVVAMVMASGNAHAQSVRVPGFLPTENAFQIGNNWPAVPYRVINVAGFNVPIGKASNGMCGGMVYAVRDYYESGFHIPLRGTLPTGTLFDFIA